MDMLFPVDEIIRKRKSVRTFDGGGLRAPEPLIRSVSYPFSGREICTGRELFAAPGLFGWCVILFGHG